MKISIYKFDPAVDAAPYYATADIPWKDKMTVLEAIVYFHENVQEISYDYSCHGRMCGRCSVMVDGKPVLACCTPITDADHVIEPLKGQTVIRDLTVDKSEYHDRLAKQYQRIRTEPVTAEQVHEFDKEAADHLWNLVNCTRCGCCDAACPVFAAMPDKFAGPSMMLALAFRHLDSYDQGDRVLEAVSKGLYHCIMCGQCDAVCKRYEIKHVEMWQMLRDEAEKRGLKPSYAK